MGAESAECVERVWVPLYKFAVTEAFGREFVEVHNAVGDEAEQGRDGKMSFCLRACELQALDRRQVLEDRMIDEGRGGRFCQEPDDLLFLSQGSWKEFAHLWARHRLQGCLSTGFKLVYGMTPPDRTFFSTEGFHIHVLAFIMGFRLGCRESPVPRDGEDGTLQFGCGVGDRGTFARFSVTSKAVYRVSRMHHLWPFGRGIIVVGLHVDPVTER